jgi:hypothetical protein
MRSAGNDEIRFPIGPHQRTRSDGTIRFAVLGTQGENRYLIRLGKENRIARSGLPLTAGKEYTARIESRNREFILTDAKQLTETNSKTGGRLMPDPLLALVYEAFLRQGASQSAVGMKRITDILGRMGRRDLRSARILAMADEKGIRLDKDAAVRLLEEIERKGEQAGKEGNAENGSRNGKRRSQPDFLAFTRSVLSPKGDSGDMLALFNHFGCRGENWIIVPYRYEQERESGSIAGTIRMRVPAGTASVDRLVVESEYDGVRWTFLLETGREKSSRCRVFCTSREESDAAGPFIENFAEKLQNIGIETVDISIENADTDGFGQKVGEPHLPVDRLA